MFVWNVTSKKNNRTENLLHIKENKTKQAQKENLRIKLGRPQ